MKKHSAENNPAPAEAVKLTVAVPTFNRAALLQETLASILAQKTPDFRVVVFDNASSDHTSAVVNGFSDARLTCERSPTNIGLTRNWNRAIQRCTTPYLCICCDDDLILDGFFAESLAVLEANPSVGFIYARAKLINQQGQPLGSQPPESGLTDGVMDGLDFLERMVAGQPGTIYPSAVIFRTSALAAVGGFDSPHSKINIDRNLYYRLARRYSVAHLDRELIAAREHPGQETETYFRDTHRPGMIGALAERLDAAAYLVESPRAADPAYRRWLTERLLTLHQRQSDVLHGHIPGLYWGWHEQLDLALGELENIVPAGAGFILVDEDTWGLGQEFRGRRVWPYLEKDGLFWGAPTDQESAVAGLQRLQQSGAQFIAFAWTTFWWLDFYADLGRHLRTNAERVLWSPRLMVFRLLDV